MKDSPQKQEKCWKVVKAVLQNERALSIQAQIEDAKEIQLQ